ncbi:MAG: ATP-binding cassette domain-containing protein, partial [Bacteroidales bacterium]
MSESILNALMQLFALIIDIHEDKEISSQEKEIVRLFLSRQLNTELTEKYMKIFNEYLKSYHESDIERDSIKDRKRTSLISMRILGICESINKELEQKQKIYLIIQLIEFISFGQRVTVKELEFLFSVASAFNIPDNEYRDLENFIFYPENEFPEKKRMLTINGKKKGTDPDIKHIYHRNLSGDILFLFIPSTNEYIFRYLGNEDLYLNGQNILPGQTNVFDLGSSIRNPNVDTLFFSDIAGKYSAAALESKISLKANNIEFRFRNSENGIQNFNFSEESGNLVGIIGGSGVGKSTLLNILNGNIKPGKGAVYINGYNIHDKNEKSELKGVIGFVPQDDLLIEELTVYENLWYNAKLCLDDFGKEKRDEIINQVLYDLDLYDIKDLKVGNILNKIISGGQRKRINIALELVREPSVLFIDEPTSGLSSVDSDVVMNLLKEQAYKGRLVIVNIHQPSSDIYKMFDRIVILDKGGYQVYYGNPTEAIVYFKSLSHHVNPYEDQCVKCGNINPDQILQIIEAKVVNEHGKLTRTRKVTPGEWFELFQKKFDIQQKVQPVKEKMPENNYKIPALFRQMRIFFSRDLLSKLSNRQNLLISLLEAPLLAVILGLFTKYFSDIHTSANGYLFRENVNLPAYLFMSAVVALFLGLNMSSGEIIRDRKILKRESFLNLSRFSYLNSKILVLFLLSAIQTISYVLAGNIILGIKGMTISYWLALFSTSCAANMLGLNISSGLSSIIATYILIPFLLIPQLLFSGVTVKFEDLHKVFRNPDYVPVIGDIMTLRWAYEALAVHQFRNNHYQKYLFDTEKEKRNAYYYADFHIPALISRLNEADFYIRNDLAGNKVRNNLELLR